MDIAREKLQKGIITPAEYQIIADMDVQRHMMEA
jgi:hypothetical protein